MYRSIATKTTTPTARAKAVVVALFDSPARLPARYKRLDQQTGGVLAAAIKRAEYSAAQGAVTVLYPQPRRGSHAPARLFVLGLGKTGLFSGDVLREAGAQLLRAAWRAKVDRLSLQVTAGIGDRLTDTEAGQALADGISAANASFDTFKGSASGSTGAKAGNPNKLTLEAGKVMAAGLRRGLTVGDSVNLARRLAATPPNVANPAYLVRICRKMARERGLKCSVIDAKRAQQLGMGGLVAVGRAGSTPPALICLEYRPTRSTAAPVMLVGKAVTFDTGGYSIKPSAGMESMKYDKCGGMAVIGAMEAVARLKIKTPVVGLIAAAENMVDQKAYRPSDILTMYNGVTVEVVNTDAEGRLVLGDALAYGAKRYKPRAVIDLATLTGGVVVALGSSAAGLFSNDDKICSRLLDAAQTTGERLWRLPLWDVHRRQMAGHHSDILNSAGREAHPIQGAAFLSHFVDIPRRGASRSDSGLPKTPWAHLDIAGVSDVKGGEHPIFAKGPTGFGVRLLVDALATWPTSGRPKR